MTTQVSQNAGCRIKITFQSTILSHLCCSQDTHFNK